jgi:hypothetical protein
MKTRNKHFDKKNGIILYYHMTDGGAEYLTNKFIECPDGSQEGIFEGATIIIRIDGNKDIKTL